jgi:hypothetical protein
MYLNYNRLVNSELSPFLKLDIINDNVWLAGGAIRSVINKEPIFDYDLFFKTTIDAANTRVKLEGMGADIKFKCPLGLLTTYMLDDMKMQCITENFYPSLESLIDTFDITACRYATDGKKIYTRYSSVRDTISKKINFHRVDFPVATMKRVAKYAAKGYTFTSNAAQLFVQDVYSKGLQGRELNTRVYID